MKNTSRTRNNNATKPTSVKSSKGHEPAKSGHALSQGKSKITRAVVRLGDALGLTDNEIEALALVADFNEQSPLSYCQGGVRYMMETSFDIIQAATRHQFNDEAYDKEKDLLPIISKLLPRPPYKKQPAPIPETLLLQDKKLLHIRVTEAELRALTFIKKVYFPKTSNVRLEWVANWLMLLILQKPRVLNALWREMAAYKEAEGLDDFPLLISRIAAHSTYRKTKHEIV